MSWVSSPTRLSSRCFHGGWGSRQSRKPKSDYTSTTPPPLKIEEWLRVEQNNTPNVGAPGCLAPGRGEGLPNRQPRGWAEEGLRSWETTGGWRKPPPPAPPAAGPSRGCLPPDTPRGSLPRTLRSGQGAQGSSKGQRTAQRPSRQRGLWGRRGVSKTKLRPPPQSGIPVPPIRVPRSSEPRIPPGPLQVPGAPNTHSGALVLTSTRQPGRWTLPSQTRRSPSCPGPGSRGGGVAGRQESFRSASQAERAKRAGAGQGRAPAGSAPPPAPRRSGSRAPPATRPAQPRQSQAPPPAAPPARPGPTGGGEPRGGGAPVWPIDPTITTPPGRTGQGRTSQLPAHAPCPRFGPGSRPGHMPPPLPGPSGLSRPAEALCAAGLRAFPGLQDFREKSLL